MRAAIVGLAALVTCLASPSKAGVISADFAAPTTRYAHGVLGDAVEFGILILRTTTGEVLIELPDNHVFEDLKPRLYDIDGDGDDEAIVIETDMKLGAALAIYDETGKLAETPHIGRAFRWLAPLGAADLDGDGAVEIAYIDRPHLAKTLRVWRYSKGALEPVADMPGLTNHRIGEDFISGGIRDCGDGPEIVTASANWSRVMVTRLVAGQLETRDAGKFEGPESLAHALDCR